MSTSKIVILPKTKIKIQLKEKPTKTDPNIEYLINENGCEVYIIRNWLDFDQSPAILSVCQKLSTIQYDFKFYGKSLKQKRKNWLCGDDNVIDHKFGGQTVIRNPWIIDFKEIRDRLNTQFDIYTNACLVNHYPDGDHSIALHSDTDLYAKNKAVFTLSLGAQRTFIFERKADKHIITTHVKDGDLLVCLGETQSFWKHGIPAEPEITEARYSLTFRGMKSK